MAKDSDAAKSPKKKSKKISLDDSVKSGSKSARSGRAKSPKPTKSPKREKSPARTSKTKKGGDDSTAPSKKSPSKKSTKRSDLSVRSADSSSIAPENVLDVIPAEYYRNPEPILHYLPKMVLQSEKAAVSTTNSKGQMASSKFPNLRVLLQAAEDDIRLHRARIQAAKARDSALLRSYKIETDGNWLVRQQRLNERELMLSKLDKERAIILKELSSETKGLTTTEKTQVQLARWQRLLELYVYMPQNNDEDLDFLGVLKNLLEGIQEVSWMWC